MNFQIIVVYHFALLSAMLIFGGQQLYAQSQTANSLLRMNEVSNLSSLNAITSPQAGNIVHMQDNLYYYDGSNWRGVWSDFGNRNVGSTGFIGTTNNQDLKFRTNNTQRMVIKNDGKVGINTDSPSGMFHINMGLNLSTNYITSGITATTNSGSGAPNVVDNNNGTSWQSATQFLFEYSNWVRLDLGTPKIIQRYRLEASSANPTSWHFQGSNNNSTWTTIHSINASSEVSWTTRDYTITSQTTAYQYYRVLMTQTLWIEESYNSYINLGYMRLDEIKVYELVSGGDFIVTTSGDIGIGTTTPTEKLQVVGNILASGSITPDYVFEHYFEGESPTKSDYILKPIEEVKKYVKTNKHLPDVPSAQDIKKQGGILVNKATEINLEKIEELYLYLFELEEENDKIEKRISMLEKKLEELEK